MHCVLFVVRANDLDEQRVGANDIDEKTYFSALHSMQQYLNNKNKFLFLLYEDITSCMKTVKYCQFYNGEITDFSHIWM